MRLTLLLGAALAILSACAAQREASIPITPPPASTQIPVRAWSASGLDSLRAAARQARDHGVPIAADTLGRIDRLDTDSQTDANAAAALEAAADALFIGLANTLQRGAVDPRVDPDWHIAPPPPPDETLLERARLGASAELLSALAPRDREYEALSTELRRLYNEDTPFSSARETRVDRLRASLERRRWLPRVLPSRRIEVLIPFFELRVVEDNQIVARHAVITGARRSPTPSFAAQIESVTLNPTWTPPTSIVLNELAPSFQRDPAAAAREGFDVLDRDGQAVDLADVNWAQRPFPYTLRQRPGAQNALGRVRFDLPNPFAVFLHDTPGRRAFERTDRALSHGCVRVSNPEDLAALVLQTTGWDRTRIEADIASARTHVVEVDPSWPIYILYLTASVNDAGEVIYADDVYRRDVALLRALDAPSEIAERRPNADLETECSNAG